MLCWLLTIVLGFWPGLIFFLIASDKPYLKRQAALSLTLSIVGMVGIFISILLSMVLIGLLLLPVICIWVLVVCIQGAIAVNKGENFNPGLVDKLCMSLFKM